MGEAVIVSAIENLGNFLLKKADLRDDEREKLSSLVVEKADLRRMAEVLVDNKEMLYRLLIRVADPFNLEEDEEEERVMSFEEKRKVRVEKLSRLVFEMADLWEDDDKESIYKDKLHTLLLRMIGTHDWEEEGVYEKLYSLAIEMAEDGKGKLSKEKLYRWLAKKADLWDQKSLFDLLHDLTTLPHLEEYEMAVDEEEEQVELVDEEEEQVELVDEEEEQVEFSMKNVLKKVEEAKTDLKIILGIVRNTDKSEDLRYFISDAAEMAHDVSLLIAVMDSDLFIFFLEIFKFFYIQHMSLYMIMIIILQRHLFTGFLEEMESIQEWLQETKERMVEFGSAESQINNVGEDLQLVDVVGLEVYVEFILRGLRERATDNMICIDGMVGIGKTTLARVVYNHPKIVDEFECRAWVCLSSRKLSRKELLINLIRQLQSKEFQKDDDVDDMLMKLEEADNRSLRQMLHQQLHCKPCFIVLDDVSKDAYFRYFTSKEYALPDRFDTRNGSKLLFTTRDKNISEMYGVNNKHVMKILDDDKSWQLLLKTALYGSSDDEKFPKQLERRGRQMLRKCNGLPLAINEVGRQWAEKRRSGSEWEEIVESSKDLVMPETLAALESTYLKWDPETKSAFLRLAFFKEGTPIRANKLEQILEQNGVMRSLDRLNNEYIIEVNERTKFRYDYRTKTYRINNVFHMLSIRKAGDEIGFEILRKDGNNNRAASHEPRHRVIHRSRDDKFNFNYSSTNQDKHLVSLFFHGGCFSDISTPSHWNHSELLKTLDMEGFGLKILPETVGELTELIYLGLRNNCIQELPRSLGRLKKLEVLDIALNFMVAVPDIIREMDSLQHLYMSDIICQKPLKIDALRNLQTLTYISVDNWTYELSGLKMMTALRKLGIEELDENTDVSKLFASLAELDHIYTLILRGFRFRSLPSLDGLGILYRVKELKLEGRLTWLPTADNFPPNLHNLSLVNSCLDEDPMPILEKLWKLKCLHLQNAYTGQQMVISPYVLDELKELVIEELWHLRNLQVGQHALKSLRRLEINSCPNLDTLPEGIQQCDYCHELKIVTTKNIATNIREYCKKIISKTLQKTFQEEIYPASHDSALKMVTIKNFAKMIRESNSIPIMENMDIQP